MQLVAGWRGYERSLQLADLHQECINAAGPGGRYLLPAELRLIPALDKPALLRLRLRLYGNLAERVNFRVTPVGRFDTALVPVGPAGQPCDRWLLAIEKELSVPDQVALYGHALGHALLNREMQLNRLAPPLDPAAGRAHADSLGELRRVESANRLDRRVLETYPLLTDLLRIPEESDRAPAPSGLRERLATWGWRGHLVTTPYVFTEGRIFISGGGVRRGRKLRADALLRYETSLPIALVQVLRQDETRHDAEARLLEYAHERLGLPFAYLLEEGGLVHEWDWTGGGPPSRRELDRVPERADLWQRWMGRLGLTDPGAGQSLCYPNSHHSGKPLRCYQEAAVNHAVIAVLRAQRGLRRGRVLLNLATGTGKTPIAFQIVWKLKRSRAIRNVLFLTDRDFLLGQAMDKHFAPFGEARARVQGRLDTVHDVIFSTYQALAGDATRAGIYRDYEPDFFDLVIVDECHRGSADDESNWRLILEHFRDAVQIGLTATPLRDDNVRTYDYFGAPVSVYSLHRGIMDGFLAPYRVRRVKLGTIAAEDEAPGPDDPSTGGTLSASTGQQRRRTTRPGGSSSQERVEAASTLVAATDVIAEHLARYLRETDPLAKTIVFCVDQPHAERMLHALERECADLVRLHDGYLQRIVSEEGAEGKLALGRFCMPEEPTPVVVTTSRLLSTGIDVETCKNVVLARPVGSTVEFKQIIGRGTRLHPPEKTWFTILDYAGATHHFFDPDFDGDPEVVEVEVLLPRPSADSAAPPVGESPVEPVSPYPPPAPDGSALTPATLAGKVADRAEPNTVPRGDSPSGPDTSAEMPERAGAVEEQTDGVHSVEPAAPQPVVAELPAAVGEGAATLAEEARLDVAGVEIGAAQETSLAEPSTKTGVTPDPSGAPPGQPPPQTVRERRDGRRIAIIGEDIYEMGPDGRPRRIASYAEYTRKSLEGLCDSPESLRSRWLRAEQRREIRDRLEDEGVDLAELAATLQVPDADSRDLLLHVTFGQPLHTRGERADRVRTEHSAFFQRFHEEAREILNTVLDKYVAGEAKDINDPGLLELPPLSERGTFMELARPFGGGSAVRAALRELERLLYPQ